MKLTKSDASLLLLAVDRLDQKINTGGAFLMPHLEDRWNILKEELKDFSNEETGH